MICENDFDHDIIIQKYNELKEKHPEFDERALLEKVFSKLSKDFNNDFTFPETMSKSVGEKKIINNCVYNNDGFCTNEMNENYKKRCSYENQDECPTSDFIEDIIKKCKDCKKEKEVYYKGKDFYLCEECYRKREKHYVEVYDSFEDLLLDMTINYEISKHNLYMTYFYNSSIQTITHDLIHDEAKPIRYVPSKIPSGQTRLQKLWEQQKAFERAKRLGKEIGVESLVGGVQSITLPFSVTNTQTGVTLKGEVVENLEKNTKQLTPLSSSNARASGQFKNELLVQFHPSKLTPMRTYRYMFETPEQAKEANEALQKSGSPGRWIWQNIRGHIAGEKVTASKIAPSLSPPGQGLPTIGGTSASLVPYKISNRVPVSRVRNFNQILKEMKRTSPNPTTNPMTGSRLESLLGTRKELRELGNKNFRRGTYGLPPVGDFIYIGNLNKLKKLKKEVKNDKKGNKENMY